MTIARAQRNVEDFPEFNNHKLVTFFYDKASGLRAFIAIHSDALGPATGGTRMWTYPSEREAMGDALNLSKAMTYKCALAGVQFGGGKGVILGDPDKEKTPERLRAYARLLNQYFGDRFRTGTDVGLTDADVKLMSKENPFLVGAINGGKLSISKMATLGVWYAIQGCFEEVRMDGAMRGRKFAVKGLGKTGMELVKLLYEQGADIVAADIAKEKVAEAKRKFPKIKLSSPSGIHREKADVYCPCALGGDLNQKSVRELKCQFIVGTANNQLAASEIGAQLHRRGILYAPDYAVNSGGLINVVDELEPGGYNRERVLHRVKNLKFLIRKIIARSQKEKRPTSELADHMAEEIFMKKRAARAHGATHP